MAKLSLPSQDILNQLLDYDPDTGILRWKSRSPDQFMSNPSRADRSSKWWNTRMSGSEAFCIDHKGYRRGSISKIGIFFAHRVIWKMVHGVDPDEIDHINGNTTDNRLLNLRNVTPAANSKNRKIYRNNRTGVVGVYLKYPSMRYQALISVNGRLQNIGRFGTIEEAAEARRKAEIEYGYHENHARSKNRRQV